MSTKAATKDFLSHDRFVGVERPLVEGVAGHKVRRTNLVGVGGEMVDLIFPNYSLFKPVYFLQ
jgi:hypothetical protein